MMNLLRASARTLTPQASLSPSHYFLTDLIGNALPQSSLRVLVNLLPIISYIHRGELVQVPISSFQILEVVL
jgi:hypothetical protein